MADLSHELGALRFVVDSPLSSKVAMFNNQVSQHKQGQLLNPFSQTDGRSSPKPSFSKDEYGKPLAGSLTEARGQKANMHVLKEMLELCQIIDSEGYNVKDEPDMRVIPFGELFNIYNYISDKVVGILLRARKHKLLEFEGEMLFQRRDDDVPIFLLKPVAEIRRELNDKIESIKRAGSPAPQSTSVLLDKKAYGLDVPKGKSSASRTPSPQSSKASSPARDTKKSAPAQVNAEKPKIQISREPEETPVEHNENKELATNSKTDASDELKTAEAVKVEPKQEAPEPTSVPETQAESHQPTQGPESSTQTQQSEEQNAPAEEKTDEQPSAEDTKKNDVNNNPADLPVVVIEASAVHVRSAANNEPETQTNANAPATEAPVAAVA